MKKNTSACNAILINKFNILAMNEKQNPRNDNVECDETD